MPKDNSGLPPSPMTELAEAASSMHELFTEWVKAGFTERQALYLCGQVLRGSMTTGGEDATS